jgi:hypothetical protein
VQVSLCTCLLDCLLQPKCFVEHSTSHYSKSKLPARRLICLQAHRRHLLVSLMQCHLLVALSEMRMPCAQPLDTISAVNADNHSGCARQKSKQRALASALSAADVERMIARRSRMSKEALFLGYNGPEYSCQDMPHPGSTRSSSSGGSNSKGSAGRIANIAVSMNGSNGSFIAAMQMPVDDSERTAPLVDCATSQFEAMWQMDFQAALQQSSPAHVLPPANTPITSHKGTYGTPAVVTGVGAMASADLASTGNACAAAKNDLNSAAAQCMAHVGSQTREALPDIAAPSSCCKMSLPQSYPLLDTPLRCSGLPRLLTSCEHKVANICVHFPGRNMAILDMGVSFILMQPHCLRKGAIYVECAEV